MQPFDPRDPVGVGQLQLPANARDPAELVSRARSGDKYDCERRHLLNAIDSIDALPRQTPRAIEEGVPAASGVESISDAPPCSAKKFDFVATDVGLHYGAQAEKNSGWS